MACVKRNVLGFILYAEVLSIVPSIKDEGYILVLEGEVFNLLFSGFKVLKYSSFDYGFMFSLF